MCIYCIAAVYSTATAIINADFITMYLCGLVATSWSIQVAAEGSNGRGAREAPEAAVKVPEVDADPSW